MAREEDVSQLEQMGKGLGVDPEGLFKNAGMPSGGHFARREAMKNAEKEAAAPVRPMEKIRTLPAEMAVEGIPANVDASWDGGKYDVAEMRQLLAASFMAVDLDAPGVRVHCMDPPVLTVAAFLPPAVCEAVVTGAAACGEMQSSQVGGATAGSASNDASGRRTSTSTLLLQATLDKWPNLAASVEALQGSLRSVLPGGSWEPMGRLPSPGALCFESPQVACYEKGQQFMAHEDAFPAAVMVQNEFQRRATLLVYLNDVAGGGGTRFVHLGVTIRPARGKALLFFPAKADGSPDARTLHEAQVAEDTKWIAQQWVAWGVGGAWGVGLPAAAAGFEELLKQRKQSSGGKKGKKGQAATKGFGKR